MGYIRWNYHVYLTNAHCLEDWIMFKKWLRRMFAKFRGTFVTDCPVCYTSFYGFEAYGVQVLIGKINYRITCQQCMAKHSVGEIKNAESQKTSKT